MSDEASLRLARDALRARLAGVLGAGEVVRLDQALTHKSYANETGVPDNQRLEFLGDAVLGLCVSELLARAHPDADEGRLSRMRAALVNAEALARWARGAGLGGAIALGRGARARTERDETNVLADAVEALVAAVYEAHGLDGARALVAEIVHDGMQNPEALDERDPKGRLQEIAQARGMGTPAYRVVGTRNDNAETLFDVEVFVGALEQETVLGRGEGRSKRIAEKGAARDALSRLEPQEPAPPPSEA